MAVVLTVALAAVATLALTPVAAAVASRLGVVDRPGPLKVHAVAVPYLGGVAIAAGVAVAAWADPRLLLPLVLALLLGLADDVADLPPPFRLGCEVVIGVAAAFVVPTRGILGAAVTVVLVVALLNAVNLLDGLDGLAAGTASMAAGGFAVVLTGDGRVLALALLGALLGFLAWNRPPARIYMGDAGSYFVGTALALLLAFALGVGEPVSLASGALLFVAVPVADTSIAIVRRLRAGRPLLGGDRGHLYDQLVDRGSTAPAATLACVGAQAVLVVLGLGITALPGVVAVAASALVIVGVGAYALHRFTSPASWST